MTKETIEELDAELGAIVALEKAAIPESALAAPARLERDSCFTNLGDALGSPKVALGSA